MRRACGSLLALGIALAAVAPSAAATGRETFRATIVASGTSGDRTVVSTSVVAKGVFTGHGTIVEIDNLPGDPENLFRDDFVFADGTIHVLTSFEVASFSLDPRSCRTVVELKQTAVAAGGTGRFAAASGTFAATVHGKGTLPRNPDGSCATDASPLHEVDSIEASGTLAF